MLYMGADPGGEGGANAPPILRLVVHAIQHAPEIIVVQK